MISTISGLELSHFGPDGGVAILTMGQRVVFRFPRQEWATSVVKIQDISYVKYTSPSNIHKVADG